MAIEFEVGFLGRIPIDPQFVMLLEAGRTPVYPVGTVINGENFGPRESGDASTSASTKDPETLANKYRECSLSRFFGDITQKVIGVAEARSTEAQKA
jgi:hypothetical protein